MLFTGIPFSINGVHMTSKEEHVLHEVETNFGNGSQNAEQLTIQSNF